MRIRMRLFRNPSLAIVLIIIGALITLVVRNRISGPSLHPHRADHVTRYTYTLQEYDGVLSDASSSTIFWTLVRIAWPSRMVTLKNLVCSLLRCADRFVWGVQQRGTSIGLEFYFYAPDVRLVWPCISSVLRLAPMDTIRGLTFVPQMISVEIHPEDLSAGAVDVYHIQNATNGYCVRANGDCWELKNVYYFVLKPELYGLGWRANPDLRAESELAALAEVQSFRPTLLFDDWRVSACIAPKKDGRLGVYYSGVPVRRVLACPKVPAVFSRCLKSLELRNALIDVGYDERADQGMVGLSLYGAIDSLE